MGSYETVGHTHTHGDSRARGNYEETSINVLGLVDIHAEVDPTIHLGHMMMHEDIGACMTSEGNMMMRYTSQEHAKVYSGIQGDTLDYKDETYLMDHGGSSPLQQYIYLGNHIHSSMNDDGWRVIDQQFVDLPIVVPDGWSLVMSTGDYSPWVLVDKLLVNSLELTKAYDTFQYYSRLQIFVLAFPNTFIIDS